MVSRYQEILILILGKLPATSRESGSHCEVYLIPLLSDIGVGYYAFHQEKSTLSKLMNLPFHHFEWEQPSACVGSFDVIENLGSLVTSLFLSVFSGIAYKSDKISPAPRIFNQSKKRLRVWFIHFITGCSGVE